MIFLHNKTPKIGDIKKTKSFCVLPCTFKNKTYWLHKVEIVKEFTKDYSSTYVDGGGWTYDDWKVIQVNEL